MDATEDADVQSGQRAMMKSESTANSAEPVVSVHFDKQAHEAMCASRQIEFLWLVTENRTWRALQKFFRKRRFDFHWLVTETMDEQTPEAPADQGQPITDEFISTFRTLVDGLPENCTRESIVDYIMRIQDRADQAAVLEDKVAEFEARVAELFPEPAMSHPTKATAMSNDILERLNRLEEENRRLQSLLAAKPAGPVVPIKPTTTYVDLWQGKPILRFDGPFKPFGIGWKKASVILECIDALKFFVENNKSDAEDGSSDG